MMEVLRRLHRWVGLALLLPLMLQGVSGTILVLEPLWDAEGATTAVLPLNAVLAAARAVAPEGMRPGRILPGSPTAVMFQPQGRPRGGGVTIRIDPSSLAQVGPATSGGGVIDWVRGLHNNLLIPEYAGRSILGWEGVGLVLLAVLGIPIWWPRKRQVRAAFTIAPQARGAYFHRRLHGAVGIWVLPVLLASAATGVSLGFPQTARALLGVAPGGPPRAAPGPATTPPVPDLDRAVALARAALPGDALRMLFLPAGARDPLRIFMAHDGQEGAVSGASVTLSGDGGRVLSVQPAGSLPAGEMALRWARDLHVAQGLGWGWRLLNAAAGLALPVFGVTGFAMWVLKRRNRRRMAARSSLAANVGN